MKIDKTMLSKAGLYFEQHKSGIMLGAGIVMLVKTLVETGKSSIKAVDMVNDSKAVIETINDVAEKAKEDESIEYSEEDKRKDLMITYGKLGGKLLKVYSKPVFDLLITGFLLGGSYKSLKDSNYILSTSYIALNERFKKYRDRVEAAFGEKAEKDIRYAVCEDSAVSEESGDDSKNNKKKKGKRTIRRSNLADGYSEWTFCFDESHPEWRKDPVLNKQTAILWESEINDKCLLDGHIMMWDVYDICGMDQLKPKPNDPRYRYGFKYDPNTRITLGFWDIHDEPAMDFINGYERSVIIDPVDSNGNGPINLVDMPQELY